MKKLPIVNAPSIVCTLPVSGQKVKFRPFVVKEQKAMLLAKESENKDNILETIKDVVTSCTSGTLDFSKASIDDISYFFLQLRIASVGPDIKFSLPCVSCQEPVLINLDLSQISLDVNNAVKDVKITDTIGIRFRFPTFDDTIAFENSTSEFGGIEMIKRLVEFIYDEDQIFMKSDYTDSELEEWILNLNNNQLMSIETFFKNIPHLSHELKFSCPHCKTEQSRLLEGLHNFFRLGASS